MIVSRATQAELLEQRIAENAASQEIDLATWIFERVHVQAGSRVLELCCGTGGQTIPLLDRVGNSGQVVALDISPKALSALRSKVGTANQERLTLVECGLDDFSSSLLDAQFQPASFDLVFCAYGLYYSADAQRTLEQARPWLRPEGRIAVVGPFGPNNQPLFDLVRASGVRLAESVTFSSERFMLQTVLPWAARNFASTAVHTMVNPVRWSTPERVLNYWQNTTFYDAEKRPAFEQLLEAHFAGQGVFVNEKWVMLAEMSRGR
ncbi:MAG: class I SAM-dependent methyltransferase [Candidatus Sulfotelmatobacter sp.]